MIRWSGPTCCRPGPGGTRAGAAVVAVGVGSPIARLGARRWRRRREVWAAVGAVGAELATQVATQVLGARAAAVAIAVRVWRAVRGHAGQSDAVLGADRHRGRRPARAGRSPRSRSPRWSLRTRRRGRRRCRGNRSGNAPVGAPPEGNAKEVTRRRRRVTTAALRDDSVVAHGSLPAAWSDSGVTVAERWPW